MVDKVKAIDRARPLARSGYIYAVSFGNGYCKPKVIPTFYVEVRDPVACQFFVGWSGSHTKKDRNVTPPDILAGSALGCMQDGSITENPCRKFLALPCQTFHDNALQVTSRKLKLLG